MHSASDLCYRCGFCGREFLNSQSGIFLAHMRTCTQGPETASTVQSTDLATSDNDAATDNHMTDTRSEASSQPKKRGRKPGIGNQRKPAVFLNRSQPKTKQERPAAVQAGRSVYSHFSSNNASLSEEVTAQVVKEILHGGREAVVQLIQDDNIEQLASLAVQSGTNSVRLPSTFLTKPSGSSSKHKPKTKTVAGLPTLSKQKPLSTLACKYCHTSFSSTLELSLHMRYCASGFVAGDSSDLHKSGSDVETGDRGGLRAPDIPVDKQFCSYCNKHIQFWRKMRTHLLRGCQERQRLARLHRLPVHDQFQTVERELAKQRLKAKTEHSTMDVASEEPLWTCEYCFTQCSEKSDLMNHLRRCSVRLQMISDDELIAPEDQLNRLKRMPASRGVPAGRLPKTARDSVSPVAKAMNKSKITHSAPPASRKRTSSSHISGTFHNGKKSFECCKCHSVFETHGNYKNHISDLCEYSISKTEIPCPGCGKMKRFGLNGKVLKAHLKRYCPGRQDYHAGNIFMPTLDEIWAIPPQSRTEKEDIGEESLGSENDMGQCETCGETFDLAGNHVCLKKAAVSVFQGEDNIVTETDVGDILERDKDKGVESLLAELADTSPLGNNLETKLSQGKKLEIDPPPVVLRPGMKLVNVFDCDGSVFKVPFDTLADPQTALMGVVSSISTRQKLISKLNSDINSAVAATPTNKIVSERKSSLNKEGKVFHSKIDSDTNEEADDFDDGDSEYSVSSEDVAPKAHLPPPPPSKLEVNESYITSAEWVRRQNQSRVASGGRRVKVNTRYLE